MLNTCPQPPAWTKADLARLAEEFGQIRDNYPRVRRAVREWGAMREAYGVGD